MTFRLADLRDAARDGGLSLEQQFELIAEVENLQVTITALQSALRITRHLALIREQRIKELLPARFVGGTR